MTNDKINILLIDNNSSRLNTVASVIVGLGYSVTPKRSIGQYGYEENNYDIVLAHYGNTEVEDHILTGDWNSGDAVMIYFSGGLSVPREKDSYGNWWVSAFFMEKRENISLLLKEAYEQWL
jgi:hypothetical protein